MDSKEKNMFNMKDEQTANIITNFLIINVTMWLVNTTTYIKHQAWENIAKSAINLIIYNTKFTVSGFQKWYIN